MKQTLIHVSVATALLTAAVSAMPAPVTFFGEDAPANNAPATTHPNADSARASFFGNLTGVGTETFESIASGTAAPFAVSFGSAGSATVQPSGSVASGATSSNQFPISGNNFFLTSSTFGLSFSAPISAFGFYATDVGDGNAQLSLTLTGSNGTTTLIVPNAIGNAGDGSALYFAFYDTANTYSSITVGGANADDTFGFDDFSIGARANVVVPVVPTGVPEPETLAMLGIGLAGIAAARRRR